MPAQPAHTPPRRANLLPQGKAAPWGFAAFGLAVSSDLPLVGALPGWTGTGNRPVAIRHDDRDAATLGHNADTAVTLLERRYANGALGMRVSRVQEGGYRVEAPESGTFAVASDGSVINCEHRQEPAWRWHRALYGQALPLAATLQGFELFHASAVALGGRAIAFVAPSGSGKTSLATQLAARGIPLLTDDVLSLECRDGTVLGHPGARMANIPSEQLELMSPTQRARLGTPVGKSDKVHVEVHLSKEPLPLGAVFFLLRSEQIERIAFQRGDPPDPRDLLSATFMKHITNPARLITQLDTCAEIAAKVPTFHLLAPARLTAAELAIAVEHQAEKVLA